MIIWFPIWHLFFQNGLILRYLLHKYENNGYKSSEIAYKLWHQLSANIVKCMLSAWERYMTENHHQLLAVIEI